MTSALAVSLLLVFLRIAGFVAFLPPFSGRQMPHTVKIGLVLALTVMWGTQLTAATVIGFAGMDCGNWLLVGWLAARETLLGAALGWLLGLILVPIRVAGAYIVQEMGLTMAAITSATEGGESNVLSQAFEIAAVLAIFGLNLHHRFLRIFDATFELFPLGRAWTFPSQSWVLGTITGSTEVGLSIAAPVGIVLLATLVTTLFVMRQAPQFNLMSFGMPVRVFIGVVATAWFLPEIITGLVRSMERFASLGG